MAQYQMMSQKWDRNWQMQTKLMKRHRGDALERSPVKAVYLN